MSSDSNIQACPGIPTVAWCTLSDWTKSVFGVGSPVVKFEGKRGSGGRSLP